MNINEELINEAIQYIMPVRDVFAKGSRLAKEKLRKQEQQKRRQQKILQSTGSLEKTSVDAKVGFIMVKWKRKRIKSYSIR